MYGGRRMYGGCRAFGGMVNRNHTLASDVLYVSVRHMYCSVVVKHLSAIAPALA